MDRFISGIKVLLVWLFVLAMVGSCSLATIGTPGNLDYVKAHAVERWAEMGFEVVGYDGYQWGFWGINDYGGAKVWHILRKIPDNGITYGGYLQRWGNEIHMYNVKAIDAIKP